MLDNIVIDLSINLSPSYADLGDILASNMLKN